MAPFDPRVLEVLRGTPVPFGPNGEPSAIDKKPVSGPVEVGLEGLAGDAQGNPERHGGPEMAVHIFPSEHYADFLADDPRLADRLAEPGAFGENLSSRGLTEENVCIGDVVRIGTTLLQVSQTRNPCWKLNVRFQDAQMSRKVQKSARLGWYYRVLETGHLAAGEAITLEDRPRPDWTLERLIRCLYFDKLNFTALGEIAALPELEHFPIKCDHFDGANGSFGQARRAARCLCIGQASQRTRKAQLPHRRQGDFGSWSRCAPLAMLKHRHAKRA